MFFGLVYKYSFFLSFLIHARSITAFSVCVEERTESYHFKLDIISTEVEVLLIEQISNMTSVQVVITWSITLHFYYLFKI